MQPVHLVVEALRVQGALCFEDLHGMIDMPFFLGCDGGKGFAQTPRAYLADTGIAGDGEGFQHDLLNDQAANKVTVCDAAQECLAEPLPMLPVDVIGDVQSHLASLASEGSSMPPLSVRVLQCIGYFFGIVAYLRKGGIVHRGD